MDKRKSLLNVSVAIVFKIVILVLSLLTRRFLIKLVGNDANGINSLYTSVIGFLAVADLGISSAINFCMYKPIAQNNKQKVASLYNLFKKVYRIIGLIILLLGLIVTPFIPYLAKGYSADFNLYFTFLIMLISVVLTYFYSAKMSLINAYKNNYISTTISSVAEIIRDCLQILVLFLFKSFELYLVCRIVAVTIQWILSDLYTKKHYKDIISTSNKVDNETKNEVVKNTKAMFMHKIGGLLVNTADSIIISAFVGVEILGKYSNYSTIVCSMVGVISLFFTPLTSIMGHLCSDGDIKKETKVFHFMYIVNFIIGIVFFLGYYAVIDSVIEICFGANLVMDKSIPIIITVNYFIQFLRQAELLFRDATGTFYNDRFKPIIEGTFNVILSIILVNFIGVLGVIVATIITNLLICHIVEPYVLFKYAYHQKPYKFYALNYSFVLIFCGLLFLTDLCMVQLNNVLLNLLVNGCIAVGIALIPIIFIIIFDKGFRNNLTNLFKSIFKKKKLN